MVARKFEFQGYILDEQPTLVKVGRIDQDGLIVRHWRFRVKFEGEHYAGVAPDAMKARNLCLKKLAKAQFAWNFVRSIIW